MRLQAGSPCGGSGNPPWALWCQSTELEVRICPVAHAVPLGSFGCWGSSTADSPCRQEIHVKWTRLNSRCLCKQLHVGVPRSGMKQGCLAREGPWGCSSASTFLSCGQGTAGIVALHLCSREVLLKTPWRRGKALGCLISKITVFFALAPALP